MRYCAICGRQHDPDIPCFDGANQALREAGFDVHPHAPRPGIRRIVRQADKWILKVLLTLLALLAAIAILSALLAKKSF
jgi:hypothetical protein